VADFARSRRDDRVARARPCDVAGGMLLRGFNKCGVDGYPSAMGRHVRLMGFHHPNRVAGMFGWLKSRDRKTAENILALLAKAIKEVHPNRYIDPSEARIVTRRKLSQLNLLLGRGDRERFVAVAFDDLVAMTSDYERRGYAEELGSVIAHDAVLIALVAAAMHERHGQVMRDEVRQRAKQLLGYVNPA
jgi:hypothetical protein